MLGITPSGPSMDQLSHKCGTAGTTGVRQWGGAPRPQAPCQGSGLRDHGNRVLRVLGAPPHCLTPVVPPPVHQWEPKSPTDCPSLLLIQPARHIPSFRSPLFGSRTEETYFRDVLLLPGSCCPVGCRHLPSLRSGDDQGPTWKNLFSFPCSFLDENKPPTLDEF